MKRRFRIAPTIVDRFKEDICSLVDIDHTYIQVVEPQETFLDPLSYELNDDIAFGCIYFLLNLGRDKEEYRFGTYDEITQSIDQSTLEKASHKKVESIMKKALSKARMTQSESEAIRKIMEQGILNIQALLVSIAKTSSEQSILYVAVLDVQPMSRREILKDWWKQCLPRQRG